MVVAMIRLPFHIRPFYRVMKVSDVFEQDDYKAFSKSDVGMFSGASIVTEPFICPQP